MLGKVLVTLNEELTTENITKLPNSELLSPNLAIAWSALLDGSQTCFYSTLTFVIIDIVFDIMEWLLSYSGYLPLGNKSDSFNLNVRVA